MALVPPETGDGREVGVTQNGSLWDTRRMKSTNQQDVDNNLVPWGTDQKPGLSSLTFFSELVKFKTLFNIALTREEDSPCMQSLISPENSSK